MKNLLFVVSLMALLTFSGCTVSSSLEAAKYVAQEKVVQPLKDHRFYSCVDYGSTIKNCPEEMDFFRIDPIRSLGDDIELCYSYKPNEWQCDCPDGTKRIILDIVK